MPKTKIKTKKKSVKLDKKKYQLTVRIGKENQPDAVVKKFKNIPKSEGHKALIKCLLTIPTAKIMLNVTITLEIDGKKAVRPFPSFKARLAFTNKFNAFLLMKQMHWMLK